MKKILITGALGFSGKYLTSYLVKTCPLNIIQLDIFNDESENYYQVNLENPDEVKEIINKIKPDYLVHLAGITKSPNYQDFYRGNLFTSINLLDALVQNKLFDCKILLVSSSAVYGNNSKKLLSENSRLFPINHYGNSKIAMENTAIQYYRNFKLKINIARPFNIIGPAQSTQFVLPSLIHKLMKLKLSNNDSSFEVSDLNHTRDFIDIRDVVKAYWVILNSDRSGEIYNIGSGKEVSIKEAINKTIELLNLKIKLKGKQNESGSIQIKAQIAAIKKIKTLTWNPGISLEKSIRDIIEYISLTMGKK